MTRGKGCLGWSGRGGLGGGGWGGGHVLCEAGVKSVRGAGRDLGRAWEKLN